jgi:hypothetical protein
LRRLLASELLGHPAFLLLLQVELVVLAKDAQRLALVVLKEVGVALTDVDHWL